MAQEIKNMNTLTTSKETEPAIKNSQQTKSPCSGGFTSKFHQSFKKELILILPKLIQKIEQERTLSKLT